VHLQPLVQATLRQQGARGPEGSFPLGYFWGHAVEIFHQVNPVAGAFATEMVLDSFVLKGGILVLHRHLGPIAHFRLVNVLMLVALLGYGQDHNTGNVARRSPERQVGWDHG